MGGERKGGGKLKIGGEEIKRGGASSGMMGQASRLCVHFGCLSFNVRAAT